MSKRLTLEEIVNAPEEIAENIVKMEMNKHEIDRLREVNRKLRERNERLENVVANNKEFFEKKKIVLEDR